MRLPFNICLFFLTPEAWSPWAYCCTHKQRQIRINLYWHRNMADCKAGKGNAVPFE